MGIGVEGHMQSGLSGLLLSISSSGVPVSWEDAGVPQGKEGKEAKLIPNMVVYNNTHARKMLF